jgi:hypothetical protein
MYKTKEKNNYSTLEIGDVCGESEIVLLFKNCDNSSVCISGVVTKTLKSTETTIHWDVSQYSSNKEHYMMAYIRNAIAYILDNLSAIDKDVTKRNLDEMKQFLDLTSVQHNPLTKMLKDEIISIEEQLDSSVLDTTNNLQTSVMLGLGRGLSRARHTPNNYDTIADAFQHMNVSTTPFANRVQRELTQRITSMTADDPK